MQSITQYKANDGTVFNTEKQALGHEHMLERIELAMRPLGNTPPKVVDGKGWVQHTEVNYRKAHRAIMKLASPMFRNFEQFKGCNLDDINPMGIAGRIVCDSDSPLWKPFARLSCVDKKFREHQQPYYAINGPDRDHVCVEDRS
jgi:hypothetical protein